MDLFPLLYDIVNHFVSLIDNGLVLKSCRLIEAVCSCKIMDEHVPFLLLFLHVTHLNFFLWVCHVSVTRLF